MDENQQNELKPTDNADQTYELKRINKKLNDILFHLEKIHKYILVMLIMAAVVILPIVVIAWIYCIDILVGA